MLLISAVFTNPLIGQIPRLVKAPQSGSIGHHGDRRGNKRMIKPGGKMRGEQEVATTGALHVDADASEVGEQPGGRMVGGVMTERALE